MQNIFLQSIATPSEMDGDDVEIMDELILDEDILILDEDIQTQVYESLSEIPEFEILVNQGYVDIILLGLIAGILLMKGFYRW